MSNALRELAKQAGLRNTLRDLNLPGIRKSAPGRPAPAKRAEAPAVAKPPRRQRPAAASSLEGVIEQHYRVKEVAARLGYSVNTVRALFENEPDVLRFGAATGKREYWTLRIPESAVLRIRARLRCNKISKPIAAAADPLSVIPLRDRYARMTKKL